MHITSITSILILLQSTLSVQYRTARFRAPKPSQDTRVRRVYFSILNTTTPNYKSLFLCSFQGALKSNKHAPAPSPTNTHNDKEYETTDKFDYSLESTTQFYKVVDVEQNDEINEFERIVRNNTTNNELELTDAELADKVVKLFQSKGNELENKHRNYTKVIEQTFSMHYEFKDRIEKNEKENEESEWYEDINHSICNFEKIKESLNEVGKQIELKFVNEKEKEKETFPVIWDGENEEIMSKFEKILQE
eukprot:GAHX01000953.1.p1 GENE.GAHX01000953.1~~GAHX01000953.1.p1  ORF type:complete len:249 (+),score=66.36 GAHX01000953.1:175-921(+)